MRFRCAPRRTTPSSGADAAPEHSGTGISPVPPTPSRRELWEMPTPEELGRVDPDDLLTSPRDFKVTPLPGGCLVSFVPRQYRQRSWEWE